MRPLAVLAFLGTSCVDDAKDVNTIETDLGVDTDRGPDTDPDDITLPDTDLDDTGPPAPQARLVQGGPIVCVAPEVRQRTPFLFRQLTVPAAPRPHVDGAGLAIAPFVGAAVGIVSVTNDRATRWEPRPGEPGAFDAAGVVPQAAADRHHGLYGGSVADFDDDGDLDVLITGRGVSNRLLRNDGGGTFTQVADAVGLGVIPVDHASTGSSWSDFDGDGDLDLFVGGHGRYDESVPPREQPKGQRSFLFRNDGGVFTDVSHLLPALVHDGWTVAGLWLDADQDGDDDLYLVNDLGNVHVPSMLLWNDGGTFRADDGSSGLSVPIRAAGAAAADLDGDGLEDLVVSGPGGVRLLRRTATGWTEESRAWGIVAREGQTVSWAPTAADLDNDGRVDLAFAFGRWQSTLTAPHAFDQPDAVFLQQTPGAMVDWAPDAGLAANRPHRGISAVDLDQDGWLDLIAVDLDGKVDLALQRCGENAWISVALRQPAPNTHAVGATVEAWADGRRIVRRIRAGGSGYGAGQEPRVHLGIGPARELDRLVIRWPDGQVDVYRDVLTRQHLLVDRR